jgi:cation-transporting ATPase 13A1
MSPQAKALVLLTLREIGERTLMCGDGTNDVAALKQAHVGVGLVEGKPDADVDDDEYRPKLGAASIAAPFVSKRATISACLDLIRFGRATLSSTIDLFKQLSLNCLVSAYSYSVLFINNVKFGEQQMMIFALGISLTFVAISWAKPTRELSSERPFESQFNPYLVTSVLLQFSVHFVAFVLVRQLVNGTGYVPAPFDYKIKFSPGLMNTAMFIIGCEMQIATFVANYRGKPFMQSFFENKLLLISVLAASLLVVAMVLDISPQVRWLFEVVEFPSAGFRNKLALLCLLDLVTSFLMEKICIIAFSARNRRASQKLVDPSILEDLKSYKRNDDDIIPEEKHKFGLIDMLKQNMALQRKMAVRRNEIERDEQSRNGTKKKRGNKPLPVPKAPKQKLT